MVTLTLSAAVAATTSRFATAMGRKPHGGALRLKLPWPLDVIDPHAIDDAVAALFGSAIADPLFAIDPLGRPYPALAAALPETTNAGTRVLLRPNLLSGRGKPMDARDVLWSLARAERAGAAGLLAGVGKPVADSSDPLAVSFASTDPSRLAVALSSPLTAIVPRSFTRVRPDGTGAFVAEVGRGRITLKRNLLSARGAALLERLEILAAGDLKDSLRAFEAGETDLSWLGEFLHKPRAGAQKLDAGPFGWVVLKTGKDAGTWGSPGVAQRLLDSLPPGRLTHLGLAAVSGGAGGTAAWGGDAAEIVVTDGATHLEQIGKELSAIFSRPGHELRVAMRPRGEVEYRRARGRYSLMLELVRPVGGSPNAGALALLTSVDPALARKAPATLSSDPRDAARALPLGVVGQLRATGAYAGGFQDVAQWDLGAVWKR